MNDEFTVTFTAEEAGFLIELGSRAGQTRGEGILLQALIAKANAQLAKQSANQEVSPPKEPAT